MASQSIYELRIAMEKVLTRWLLVLAAVSVLSGCAS